MKQNGFNPALIVTDNYYYVYHNNHDYIFNIAKRGELLVASGCI